VARRKAALKKRVGGRGLGSDQSAAVIKVDVRLRHVVRMRMLSISVD
jgi:hypothetical protein